MTEVKKHLSDAEITAKATEIGEKLGKLVHPFSFIVPETKEQVIGFMTHPPMAVQLMVMDKGMISPISSAAGVMPLTIVKEHSDPRLYEDREDPISQRLFMGAVMFLFNLIQHNQNTLKKN